MLRSLMTAGALALPLVMTACGTTPEREANQPATGPSAAWLEVLER
jgi:hypothetical protein